MKNERAFRNCMVKSLCAYSATLRRVCACSGGCWAAFQAAAFGLRGKPPSSSQRARKEADSSPAKCGVSVIERNARFEFALGALSVVSFGR
jgi:hypothetical protein